jgi:hypothetical protein
MMIMKGININGVKKTIHPHPRQIILKPPATFSRKQRQGQSIAT